MTKAFHTLILAAGKGTRMNSELPKVVHNIIDKPMAAYVIEAAKACGSDEITLITGYKSEIVRKSLGETNLKYVTQSPQLGTGHAVQCYANHLKELKASFPETLLVLCGDTPLISRETINSMIKIHKEEKPAVTMMTLEMQDPGLYGRVIRKNGTIEYIREAKDCTQEELAVKEVNMAVYLFDGKFLEENIFKLKSANKQNEFYLTDLIEMAREKELQVLSVIEKDEESTLGINTRAHLAQVAKIINKKNIARHMEAGVTITMPEQTLIGSDVIIGKDTTVMPGSLLTGQTSIGERCLIGPFASLHNCSLQDDLKAEFVKAENISFNESPEPFSAFGRQ
ncbi:MAG: bifunctional N-acetylglucosamine-1-phosphate uridyltransferase/glucosamine-1-phosphate acetyltransferase [Candidatus Riflebacteria bacterium]|mgnify:CR=1 FL=1|nr:bifunctional N-acetylglucosamine-1-phosphate uridyltransferase/glucosamine-1-phosphate acetyltransferase [Candidatus Riflebacteria bacterium]